MCNTSSSHPCLYVVIYDFDCNSVCVCVGPFQWIRSRNWCESWNMIAWLGDLMCGIYPIVWQTVVCLYLSAIVVVIVTWKPWRSWHHDTRDMTTLWHYDSSDTMTQLTLWQCDTIDIMIMWNHVAVDNVTQWHSWRHDSVMLWHNNTVDTVTVWHSWHHDSVTPWLSWHHDRVTLTPCHSWQWQCDTMTMSVM